MCLEEYDLMPLDKLENLSNHLIMKRSSITPPKMIEYLVNWVQQEHQAL